MEERKGVASAIGAKLFELEAIAFFIGIAVGVLGFIFAVRLGYLPEDMARSWLGLAAEAAQSP